MNANITPILFTLIAVFSTSVVQAQAQQSSQVCRGLPGSAPQEAVAYLQQDRSTLEPECIYRSFRILKGERYRPAIDVAFHYLDFEVPGGRPRAVNPSMCTGGFYPAADFLCLFAKDLVPRVKQIIRDNSASAISRVNAAKIYLHVYIGPESIAFVAKAAQDATDRDAVEDLSDLALAAVRYCSDEQMEKCKQALNQQ